MLSKTPSDAPADIPATPGPTSPGASFVETRSFADPVARGGSVIRAETTLEGTISGGTEILVDGVVKGDVRVARVIVGPEGRVDGGIIADIVEVQGRVSGTITSKHVRLFSAANVQADIAHEQLAIEVGATFEGRSLRLKRS